MAEHSEITFFSYSHTDYRFVDRLDADLRARGLQTWVDRRRLLVGQTWREEIAEAIENCAIFLLVLTPSAANDSSYVKREVDKAVECGKTILPLNLINLNNYQARPPWLTSIEAHTQFSDFTNPDAYNSNLNKLCYAIEDPTLRLSANYDEAYHLAMNILGTDPERAAIMLQYVVANHPDLYGGLAQKDLTALELRLYPSRIKRLRAQALEAHRQGQYGVEARSLEILLALGDGDAEAVAWAKEFLPVAQQNRDVLGYYTQVQMLISHGDKAQASINLQNLYKTAPYFGDPAGIAPLLGVELPASYLHDRLAAETDRFQRACNLVQKGITQEVRVRPWEERLQETSFREVELRNLKYDLPQAASYLNAIDQSWSESKRYESEASSKRSDGHYRNEVLEGCMRSGGTFVFAEAIAIVVGWIMSAQTPPTASWYSFVWVPIVLWVVMGTAVLLGAKWLEMLEIAELERTARQAEAQAHRDIERWRQVAEQVYSERIATIKRLHGST